MSKIEPYFLYSRFDEFLSRSDEEILGILSDGHLKLHASLEGTQTAAWKEEIRIMRSLLSDFSGRGSVLFEYNIPRMGRRIDVVLIIDGVIFILEFKAYNEHYNKSDYLQVWDYALDLQNFHEESHNRIIVPILVSTEAKLHDNSFELFRKGMFYPLLASENNLKEIINIVLERCDFDRNLSDEDWAKSRYAPTPTIIEAASALYNNHSVEDISRSDASAENLTTTTQFLSDTISWAETNKKKAICFVTGVPGAGKTLVGLNTATQQFAKNNIAVYLSGNFPLVEVLTEALARDKVQREKENGNRITKAKAVNEVKTFIQMIHHYRDACLVGTRIQNGDIVIDEEFFKNVKNRDKHYAPADHIAIFDEAQRAWTKQQLANFMSRKKGVADFPMSEPEYLISCLDRHQDWAVIICLVGGGQEINTGEAGIEEWINALNERFPNWNVFISDRLVDDEYAAGQALNLLKNKESNRLVSLEPSLHLAVSMRSFRAENLSLFVHNLLNLDTLAACSVLQTLQDYPIYLTRDITKAKQWLKNKSGGNERYGIVASSAGDRLRPETIVVRLQADVVHWFLDDETDIRSSLSMEDVATEFDVQGLELDYVCVAWDADFRYSPAGWQYYQFNGGTRWNNVNKSERQLYRKNAYRVLLTRARQGMIIFIPKGDVNDPTRLPEFYDATYEYLKAVGIAEI